MEQKLQNTSVAPRRFTFSLLKNVTDNFSANSKVGSGGYGEVYKVQENWKKMFHTMTLHKSWKADSLEVKISIEIALRCVDADRTKRPTMAEVINTLKEIETLKRSLVQSSESKDRRVEVDSSELRFPSELSKQISSVLQLTNKSDDFIEFRVKANQSKYFTWPDKGVMPPWSKRYVVATMQAQEHAPPDMQCSDCKAPLLPTGSHPAVALNGPRSIRRAR